MIATKPATAAPRRPTPAVAAAAPALDVADATALAAPDVAELAALLAAPVVEADVEEDMLLEEVDAAAAA